MENLNRAIVLIFQFLYVAIFNIDSDFGIFQCQMRSRPLPLPLPLPERPLELLLVLLVVLLLEPLLEPRPFLLWALLSACLFFLLSIMLTRTRFSCPFSVAIHQAYWKCLSHWCSCSAKSRMAPKAGPFGHLELSQSPVELASAFSPTQHWFLASSKEFGWLS